MDYDGMSRKEYLQGLAEDFGLPDDVVFALANVLGPNEDFDGLITELEDIDPEGF